ncbi:class I adenylate-forming enzyme family protein [Rhodococcus sp. MSC1_016]|uniref:class I adenylate-forming enzyme family protein n=1 Tax=Rhodococcus sp. MSC1_016 TaxID=2909266 RepID=UPI00202E10CF|nr:class I adenylate-forming enzyme family protein [Rhodococcus sp. MSC1_016]
MSKSLHDRRSELLDRVPFWEPMTLHQWFDKMCEQFSDRPVVMSDGVELSYDHVRNESLDLARGLVELGVSRGDRISFLLANYPEYLPLRIAVSRVGAIAVPLNFLYRETELEYVLRQSRTNILVTMAEFSGIDYLSMLDAIAPGWSDGGQTALPDLREVVVFQTGAPVRPGATTLEHLAVSGSIAWPRVSLPEVVPQDPSDMFYTSGTTGHPKGVLNTHDGMLRSSFASALTRGMGDGWRTLLSLPLYHTFGYTEGVLAPMWVGGSVVPRVKFDAEDYLASVERFKATEFLAVPTMMVAILETARRTSYDLSTLTSVMSASAAAPAWVWERTKELLGNPDIVTAWGMTETSASCTMTHPDDSIDVHSTTVGAPKLAGPAAGVSGQLFHVATADPATGERLPAGTTGELIVSSSAVMMGYWEKPEETAEVLRDGWLHTGDIARVDASGRVVLTGRAKELYKSGGELIMPKEVEDLITKIPGVSQAFAIGIPDEFWGEAGCAVVVTEPGIELSEEQILEPCRFGLAKFKVPKKVVFMDAEELPTTPTGKVQKYRLVDLIKDGTGIG